MDPSRPPNATTTTTTSTGSAAAQVFLVPVVSSVAPPLLMSPPPTTTSTTTTSGLYHHHQHQHDNGELFYATTTNGSSDNDNPTRRHDHPPHPTTRLPLSYSAPTDEEAADHHHHPYSNDSRRRRRKSTSTDHHHHHHHEMIGTTPQYPIRLHDDSEDTNDDDDDEDGFTRVTPQDTVHRSLQVTPPPPTTNTTTTTAVEDHHPTGGRLWRLAGEVAAGRLSLSQVAATGGGGAGGPVRQFQESVLERLRSRADPDATIYNAPFGSATSTTAPLPLLSPFEVVSYHPAPPTLPPPPPSPVTPPALSLSTDTDDALYREDEAFLINTGLAHKRVRVVQLMIIGLFGILLPWMGNVFCSSNCYFASIHVVVGAYGNVYPLHFGLWNYSPVSSALNGYKYCYPYHRRSSSDDMDAVDNDDNDDDGTYSMNAVQYPSNPPVTSRLCNSLALLAGTYSLVILWWYLISGRFRRRLWKLAVYSALGAALLQMATPIFFFLGRMCRHNHCSVGPGTVLSVITAIAWMVLGAELHYHCPIIIMSDENKTSQRHENTSSWLTTTSTGNDWLWHDVRGSRPHSNAVSSHYDPTVVDVSQLEMSDFTSASQQYFQRFYPYRTTGEAYHPPDIS